MAKHKHKQRPRTYARNRAVSRRGYERMFESDGEYLLKLVLCVLLAMFWIRFGQPVAWGGLRFTGVPVGLLFGLIIVSRFEHFQSDRKIWYAVLIVFGIISYFYPTGLIL